MKPLSDIVTSPCSSEPVKVTQGEALDLTRQADSGALYEAARRVTRHCMGDAFDTCLIINVKDGHHSENCRWCAQSAHYHTQAEVHPLLDIEPCVAESRANRQTGIGHIVLVASERGQNNQEIERIAQHCEVMRQVSDIKLCASMGLLMKEQLRCLHEAGVTIYHCNMENAPSHSPKLCTTHTQVEKEQITRWAREIGLQVCLGGVVGMGETMAQRIEFACYLRSLTIRSIPINILQPIAGTSPAKEPRLADEEYLRMIALFRLINPTAFLRFSGGRLRLSPRVMRQTIYIGTNSAITDDMLTTNDMQAHGDMQLIAEIGYRNTDEKDWRTEETA